MLPVDGVVAVYNLLLAAVWLGLSPRYAPAAALSAAHLVGASLFVLLRRRPRLTPATVWLREYYPLLWTLGFWLELDYLLPLLHPVFFDPIVQRLDVALFGASWSTEWIARAPSLWLSEPMHVLYMLFPLVAVPPLWFGLTGRRDALRDVALGLTLCYLACAVVYLLFPVAGPHFATPAGASAARGLFYRLGSDYAKLGIIIGDPRGSAFPSYHVAAAVVTACVAWRWWRPAVAWTVTAVGAGLSVSTVYTQNHYVLDAVAGAALALGLEALVLPPLRRRMARAAPAAGPASRPAAQPPGPALLNRRKLYRFPWSRTDNCGGWVEVTDRCNLACPGCYRHRLQGHRPLNLVERDIVRCHQLTRCDAMAIAGGEPLIYPDLPAVVRFMARRGIKPVVLTGGEGLTLEQARELKRAGVAKFHFHVDANQRRPGWEDRSETEMNQLRQHYADLVHELGGVQCGYNVTVTRRSLRDLPSVVAWCRRNYDRVQHVSLIAFRSIPLGAGLEYQVLGKRVDLAGNQYSTTHADEISITTEEMLATLAASDCALVPSAYLNGSSDTTTYKYLIAVSVGSRSGAWGHLGYRTMELVQAAYHLARGRYCAFLRNPVAGHKVFALALVDAEVRRTLRSYLRAVAHDPRRLFERLYVQTVHLQQPNEVLNGAVNLCDDCANAMVYEDRLIPSCRWDEFRLYGGVVVPVRREVAGVAAGRDAAAWPPAGEAR
jgi:organic radical activating enzyme